MGKVEPKLDGRSIGMRPREETFWQLTWYRFRRHKMAMAAAIILLCLYSVAILAPLIAPHDPQQVAIGPRYAAPSREFLAGTDRLGRDLFSRIIWGSRVSLSVGFVAAGLSIGLGTIVGAIAGYFGGLVDDVLMRICEVMMAIPTFFLLLTVVAIFERSMLNIMLVIGLTTWPSAARLVRGQFLSLRELDYVEAAKSIGASHTRVVFRHIIPNTMAPIIVSTTLRVGGAILTESALSFIGLGVTNPASWGTLLEAGRHTLQIAPWMVMYPGVLVFITVLAYNFLGDGLRDALDPRLK